MRRRRLLASLAAAGSTGFAGCQALRVLEEPTASPTPPRKPPSLPYGEGLSTPRSLVVENRGDRAQYVTVSIWADDRNLFVDSRDVGAGERVRHPNLIGSPGTYRVVVERSDGPRRVYQWAVEGDRHDLHVRVADAVAFVQDLRCSPGCSAVDSAGTAAQWPYTPDDGRSLSYPATLYLETAGDDPRSVAVSLAHDGTEVLDYRYAVGPDERVVVSGLRAAGDYAVELASGEQSATFDWPVRAGAQLHGVVGADGVSLDCGPADGTLTLVNSQEESHVLTISVRDDARVRYAGQARLWPGERRVLGTVSEPGRYELHVHTEYGISTAEPWPVCSPLAATTVRIVESGDIEISRTYPA